MKLLVEIVKILVVSAVVVLAISMLRTSPDPNFNCSALDAFGGMSQVEEMFSALKLLAIMVGFWVAGLVIYFLLGKRSRRYPLLYFALLTALALSPVIYKNITRPAEQHRELKAQICQKSTDHGMDLNMRALSKEEYDFINSESHWLPEIPNSTISIDIIYYHDAFIGDFHLTLELTLAEGATLDTTNFPNWTNRDGKYIYEDSES